jgi:hypothetical protein
VRDLLDTNFRNRFPWWVLDYYCSTEDDITTSTIEVREIRTLLPLGQNIPKPLGLCASPMKLCSVNNVVYKRVDNTSERSAPPNLRTFQTYIYHDSTKSIPTRLL